MGKLFTSLLHEIKRTLFTHTYIMLILVSCQGLGDGGGRVFVRGTRQPLDSARVILYFDAQPEDTSISDSVGYFHVMQIVRCKPNCPELKLHVSRRGYLDLDYNMTVEWERKHYF